MSNARPAQFFILKGSVEDATPLSSQFTEIQQYGSTRMAVSAEDARANVVSKLAVSLGKNVYSIWQLVPIETIIRESKPVEFDTSIIPATKELPHAE